MQSGKKTSLVNRPIRHLYPLEASITTDTATAHCAAGQTPLPDHEDEPEPVCATPAADVPSGEGRTRPRPQRRAAQIACYRSEELARDPC